MTQPMASASAITLADGRVLVLGIHVTESGPDQPRTQLFDPATARWTRLVPVSGRAVALPDGGALVVRDSRPALRLDPDTLKWTATRPMSVPRSGAIAVTLADGRVLVAGGSISPGLPTPADMSRIAELYDPWSGRWSTTASLPEARSGGAAILLADGSALLIGGSAGTEQPNVAPSCPDALDTADRYMAGSH